MRLIAIDRNSFYFHAQCEECKEHFFYKSDGMLRSFVNTWFFDLDFKTHVLDCVDKRVTMVLGGVYEKKN